MTNGTNTVEWASDGPGRFLGPIRTTGSVGRSHPRKGAGGTGEVSLVR